MSSFELVFSGALRLGRCLGLSLPEPGSHVVASELARLPPEERALAARFGARRLTTFVGGRLAMRCLLEQVGVVAENILHDDRGAPILPAGVVGSISHKDDLAVAFVADGGAYGGVDVESRQERSQDVSSHVLRPEELERLGRLQGVTDTEEVLLRFSAKEALYKVLDPEMRRFIGFQEVSVDPEDDGRSSVGLFLKEGTPPADVRVCWTTSDALGVRGAAFFLSTAVAG